MVSFQSDNTTGSAWVSSRRRFSLPRNSESLESPFLAGDYAKADKRRKKREKRRAREQARRAPHAAQPAQPASLGPRAVPRSKNPQCRRRTQSAGSSASQLALTRLFSPALIER